MLDLSQHFAYLISSLEWPKKSILSILSDMSVISKIFMFVRVDCPLHTSNMIEVTRINHVHSIYLPIEARDQSGFQSIGIALYARIDQSMQV